MVLYKYKGKNRFIIKETPNNRLLQSLGISAGLESIIVTRMPLGGPVLIMVGKRQIALGKDLAEKILIEEISMS